jgi:hypothetical protein
LVMYARAMVDAEGARRLSAVTKTPTAAPKPNSKLKK